MKNLLVPVLILIFISAVFVYATSPIGGYQYYFNKGWNLVYGFASPNQLVSGGDIIANDIKAIYAFVPNVQEYGLIYPVPIESSKDLEILRSIDDDELLNMAFWVYSDKSGVSMYNFPSGAFPYRSENIKLYRGWNLVGVTLGMIEDSSNPDLTFNDLKGDCDVEKIYVYLNGQWVAINPLPMEETILFKGVAVKVRNDCQLGRGASVLPLPPVLP